MMRDLSEGFMSGRSLCPDGVMYEGGFVQGGFVRRVFCPGFTLPIVSKLLIFCKCNSNCVYFYDTMLVVRLLAIQYIVCMEYCLHYINYVSQF